MVEAVLELARLAQPDGRSRPSPHGQRIVDVGTGSGAIALALAKELPSAEIHATDISPEALDIARANAARHELSSRIEFHKNELLSGLPTGSFDFVGFESSLRGRVGRRFGATRSAQVRAAKCGVCGADGRGSDREDDSAGARFARSGGMAGVRNRQGTIEIECGVCMPKSSTRGEPKGARSDRSNSRSPGSRKNLAWPQY